MAGRKEAQVNSVAKILLLIVTLGNPVASAADIGGDFSLLDHRGDLFDLQSVRGKVVVLLFGYTYCPDICPTELAKLSILLGELGPRANEVTIAFVSVDPTRDSPDILGNYVGAFDDKILGLTGTLEEVTRVARQYGTTFEIVGDPLSNTYTVDHSANIYLVNKNGGLTQIVPLGFPIEHLYISISTLLESQ